MIKLESLKKVSVLFLLIQIISFSTLNAQSKSPLNVQQKLESLKTSLTEVTIMDLGGMVKLSQEIEGFENDKFLSLDEFQSELQFSLMDPETKLYEDHKKDSSQSVVRNSCQEKLFLTMKIMPFTTVVIKN